MAASGWPSRLEEKEQARENTKDLTAKEEAKAACLLKEKEENDRLVKLQKDTVLTFSYLVMGVAFAAILHLFAMTPSGVAWWFRGAGSMCSYIVFIACLITSVRVLLYGIPSTKVVRFYYIIIFVVAFLAATAAFMACFIPEGSPQYLPKACNCTLIQAGKEMGNLNDSAAPVLLQGNPK